MQEDKVLELLGIYIDLTEKQDEIILKLSGLLKKQSIELAHYRNILKLEISEEDALNEDEAQKIVSEYNDSKEP